jgi:prepilin-type N-terminal cleavage/methylation domain-containing protein
MRKRLEAQQGFTLMELLIVLAVIAILTSVSIPLFANVQQRARIAKALSDTRALATAASIYLAHCGGLPAPGVSAATNCPTSTVIAAGDVPGVLFQQQTNGQNQVGGPFMNSMPSLPKGWTGSGSSYKYSIAATGTFLACGSGDGTAANSSGGSICP